jgi:hypothetical protein
MIGHVLAASAGLCRPEIKGMKNAGAGQSWLQGMYE